jgi:type VI secretion system protein ImpA
MSELNEQVDLWLEPLEDSPCGEDLEYDNDFLELIKAAEGKPETQFSEAEPPDWRQVTELAEAMFARTRDLRVCMFWGRAQLHREGLVALPALLRLMRGLLERYWDEAHPLPDPDDGDAYARINVLAQFEDTSLTLGDIRSCRIFASRSIGQLTVRDVELALEHLTPREEDSVMPVSSIEQMLQAAVEEEPELRELASTALEELSGLLALIEERCGYERAPSCDDVKAILEGIQGLMPGDEASDGDDEGDLDDILGGFDDDAPATSRRASGRSGGLGDRIESRADAIKAIDLVCAYLEEAEPSNPAQLLLRRAQRLIDKNFLDLIRELAPEALSEVAKIMGVDPDEGRNSSSDYDD